MKPDILAQALVLDHLADLPAELGTRALLGFKIRSFFESVNRVHRLRAWARTPRTEG